MTPLSQVEISRRLLANCSPIRLDGCPRRVRVDLHKTNQGGRNSLSKIDPFPVDSRTHDEGIFDWGHSGDFDRVGVLANRQGHALHWTFAIRLVIDFDFQPRWSCDDGYLP